FLEDPLSFFRIWEGGLVFYGGFLAGFLLLLLYSRFREISWLTLGDAFAAPLFLAQSLGRIGCFAAGCCYGKPTESFVGVTFTKTESLAPLHVALHPTQLYSSLGNFLLFLGVLYLGHKRPPRGVLFASYLLGYGVFRLLIEFVRDDFRGPTLSTLFPSQWISLAGIIGGGLMLLWVLHQSKTQK
ncbi:hypothetical protein BVX98_03730, partial [bacterium F11]